ncbi:hypothetical protein MHU86_8077 [Fragilaria crotonensis]|nr:hypothetical protein MHU86_8077 [Fragilaria crotonensis]
MKDDSNRSTNSAPPMSAFQGLSLTRRPRRPRRRRARNSVHKSPIDPMDCLGIRDDDGDQYDSHSDITDDDGSSVADEASISGLPVDLQGTWHMGDMGHLEWACFAALCSLFFDPKAVTDLPPPHRAVVIGLWANVVLPPLLFEEDYNKILNVLPRMFGMCCSPNCSG